jgi:hypothetical protein
MPVEHGVPPALLDVAALDAIEAHEQGQRCGDDCPGTPECGQLQWALRRQEAEDLTG